MENEFLFKPYKDEKGNYYFNLYSNCETKSVLTIGGTNHEISGVPKIVARVGHNSKFGSELFFQFLICDLIKSYKANSDYKTVEFYLPLQKGLRFLDFSLVNLNTVIKRENNGGGIK